MAGRGLRQSRRWRQNIDGGVTAPQFFDRKEKGRVDARRRSLGCSAVGGPADAGLVLAVEAILELLNLRVDPAAVAPLASRRQSVCRG